MILLAFIFGVGIGACIMTYVYEEIVDRLQEELLEATKETP